MNTPILVGLMVALAVALLLAAIIVDNLLARRARKRRMDEEAGIKFEKRGTADAFIDILGRTGDIVRQTADSARRGNQQPKV